MNADQARAQIAAASGTGLPIDELIALRRQQYQQMRKYRLARDEWKECCASKRWWQRKPPEARIGDY